jgi:DNA-binding NarL/FixJ family response regulator
MVEVESSLDLETALPSALAANRPDVIIWDLGWEGDPDIDAIRVLAEAGIATVALAADSSHAVDARRAGAVGALPRTASQEAVYAAVLAAAAGLGVRDPSFEPDESPPRPGRLEGGESLTPREAEVLQLMAEGLPNKTIALRLGIRETTVKFHVNSILAKLGAQSRTEAVTRAARLGLILL